MIAGFRLPLVPAGWLVQDRVVEFDDLSAAEQLLWGAFPGGGWVDLRSGDALADDVSTGGGWEQERVIRAEVIGALLLGACALDPGRFPAVRLRGARVTGRLDVMGALVAYALICEHCYFDAAPRFVEATTKTVRITDSRLPALNAARMRLEGICNLGRTVIGGTLRLDRAQLTGELCLREAVIGDGRGSAVVAADGLTVNGDLDWAGMTSRGLVLLQGARVSGSVYAAGARFGSPGKDALNADHAVIGGTFDCDGIIAEGRTRLRNTRIGGNLRLRGARLDNPAATALSAGGLTVDGGMWCGQGFTAVGEVRLIGARIGGAVELAGALLTRPGGIALCLDQATVPEVDAAGLVVTEGQVTAVGAHIARRLSLDSARLGGGTGVPALVADAAVIGTDLILSNAHASGEVRARATIGGQLSMRQTRLANPGGMALDARGLQAGAVYLLPAVPVQGTVCLSNARIGVLADDPACWPEQLELDGLSYGSLDPLLPAQQRLSWLSRDTRGHQPQLFEQLAALYMRVGQPGEARRVLHARERHQRPAMSWPARAWGVIQDITVGYGYQPWRAAFWFILLLAAGSVIYAADPPSALSPAPAPHFSPVAYTLDLLLPVVDLGQKHAFNPGGIEQWLSYLLVAGGWILATTIAAGAARILSRR